ncbi:MAG: hypothetical protein IPG04_01680 [Polyangiaceae bacterium]|nr:hypothetical protein [Polyangiaceae bacterium]
MRCALIVGLAAGAATRLCEAPQPTTGAARPSSSPVAQSAQGHEAEREREAAPQPLGVASAAKELSTLVLLFVAAPDPEELVGVVEAAGED